MSALYIFAPAQKPPTSGFQVSREDQSFINCCNFASVIALAGAMLVAILVTDFNSFPSTAYFAVASCVIASFGAFYKMRINNEADVSLAGHAAIVAALLSMVLTATAFYGYVMAIVGASS